MINAPIPVGSAPVPPSPIPPPLTAPSPIVLPPSSNGAEEPVAIGAGAPRSGADYHSGGALAESAPSSSVSAPPIPEKSDAVVPLDEVEKQAILSALRATGGNRTKAADLLKISIRTLRNKLQEYRASGDFSDGEGDEV
jgi:DNA-binding NtrC family response regulator